eukprot:TRINITY_DN27061_c0_g1_i1.p1 TRINITY_DN27061_c0_g1~~TRINITY_DN27061_c0_g1_i1.p1  ORF type:complete len:616 (+),score=144.89 TRINITY_DN27061_c0_g1_i1:244-1848(+)
MPPSPSRNSTLAKPVSASLKEGLEDSKHHGYREQSRRQRSEGSGCSEQVAQERAAIVAQLEEHLAQMRTNLADSEREWRDLQERKCVKEAEQKAMPSAWTAESAQALAILTQQVLEKKRFAGEMEKKVRSLEAQVTEQRALMSGQRKPPKSDRSKKLEQEFVPSSGSKVKREAESAGAVQDAALRAFLDAAGPAANIILRSAALRDAFDSQPRELCEVSLEGCDLAERIQVLSLFSAWVAVADGDPTRAMRLSDLNLSEEESAEMIGALDTCGAQLEEWEMTRCPTNESASKLLLRSLASQPLRRLSLGYNALGPAGAASLVAAAAASDSWASSLEHLGLEMNGLGDAGCNTITSLLSSGVLHRLETLELGWNELSPCSAEDLAALLGPVTTDLINSTAPDENRQHRLCLPRFRRLGLAGNRLGSLGAAKLMQTAFLEPSRELELDLSMNHIGSPALEQLAEWANGLEANPAQVFTCIGLEWNMVDDVEVVKKVATALARISVPGPRSLLRLANNETELDAVTLPAEYFGIIDC